jgi:hypothetical protein
MHHGRVERVSYQNCGTCTNIGPGVHQKSHPSFSGIRARNRVAQGHTSDMVYGRHVDANVDQEPSYFYFSVLHASVERRRAETFDRVAHVDRGSDVIEVSDLTPVRLPRSTDSKSMASDTSTLGPWCVGTCLGSESCSPPGRCARGS